MGLEPLFELSDEQLQEAKSQAYDWAIAHGLVVLRKNETSTYITHAPFTILPSPFPRKLFEQAWALASDFNILVHELSKNYEFLVETLENVPDEFTQKLLQIYKTVHSEGIKQKIALGLHRSDYMIHVDSADHYVLQQVELNTISAAFPCLSTLTSHLHKYIISRLKLSSAFPAYGLPEGNSRFVIPRRLTHAHTLYNDPKAILIMVVQPGERNVWDQRHIEHALWDNNGVRLVRATLAEIHEKGTLNAQGALVMHGANVSVVYFRAGYTPNDYPTQIEWDARLMIERSKAIKCPNIAYHLSGAKKIQQEVANPGVLEKFITDKECVARMRACFTGLYSLSGPESEQIVEKAIEHPRDYVMKPQREGGGNNLYNDDLKKALQDMTPQERSAYILMDRIRPPAINTHVLRDGKHGVMQAVSELGIYGCFVADGDRILANEAGGLLLRTKGALQEDGGVAAGVAVLDSPVLV